VPILEHYAPTGVVCKVDANQAPEAVWNNVLAVLPIPEAPPPAAAEAAPAEAAPAEAEAEAAPAAE
jgi:hypothetical protein